ncbi:MAG: hypothetical protein ACLFP0_07175 [Rhodosalinus sp.]
MRRALRAFLGALLIVSLAWSGGTAVQLFGSGPARLWVDREADRILAEVDRQLARVAGPERIGGRVSALLAEEPRNWLALDAVLAEAARLGVALPPDLATRVEAARAEDSGWMSGTGNCLRCAWDAEKCSFDLVMLCRAPVELSPLGDIKGLADEGGNYIRGEDVDEVILILSAVGLSATGLVAVTGGGSVTVKAGAGLAKLARGMGAMPAWMARGLTDAARQGVDWAGISGVRSVDDLMALLRPHVLRPAVKTLDDAGRVVGSAGASGGLYLIGKTADAADLARLAQVSAAAGERTVGAMEILGKSRLLRTALRLSDEALQLVAGLAAAVAALVGVLLSGTTSLALRTARRRLG